MSVKSEINLLPPPYLASRTRQHYLTAIGKIMHRIIIVLLVVGVLFGAVYLIFVQSHAALQAQVTAAHQEADSSVEQVSATNALLGAVADHTLTTVQLTPRISEMLRLMPAELKLTRIEVAPPARLLLHGVFSSRDAVVAFERSLTGLPWIERVDSPLQNFATGARTEFTLTVTSKPPL